MQRECETTTVVIAIWFHGTVVSLAWFPAHALMKTDLATFKTFAAGTTILVYVPCRFMNVHVVYCKTAQRCCIKPWHAYPTHSTFCLGVYIHKKQHV